MIFNVRPTLRMTSTIVLYWTPTRIISHRESIWQGIRIHAVFMASLFDSTDL